MTVIRDVDENTANAILYGFNSETTEYFKNKYLPKLQEEMQEKINKIKKEYGANNL